MISAPVPHRWSHLVRFLAEEDGQIHLGQVDARKWPDVGQSIYDGERIDVELVTGSVFDGTLTGKTLHISKVSDRVRTAVLSC